MDAAVVAVQSDTARTSGIQTGAIGRGTHVTASLELTCCWFGLGEGTLTVQGAQTTRAVRRVESEAGRHGAHYDHQLTVQE